MRFSAMGRVIYTEKQNPLRPNILWISLEDTSSRRLGCYGDPIARTPNIDGLASEGRRYLNAFATAGICAPSRSAIITGMYQTSYGAQHMRTTHTNPFAPDLPTPYSVVPPAYVKTFTEYLRTSGYFCTNCGKTDYQFEAPFTSWDELGNDAHWRHRITGQPFFSVFNLFGTHESMMWPKKGGITETSPEQVELPPYLPDTPITRKALAQHYDNLARSDHAVGELLRQLKEDGVEDQTIVFLWSDHGDGLPRGKRWLYDAGIRVPLIVRWPGNLSPGTVSDEMISLIDLAPTVLSLAGVEIPSHLQGRPFLGRNTASREYIFAARDRMDESYDMVRAVRDQRFKYIRNFEPEQPYLTWIPYRNEHPVMQEMWRFYAERRLEGPRLLMFRTPRPVEELYDCESDPFEIHNLALNLSYRMTLEKMRSILKEWRHVYRDMGAVPEDRMVFLMRLGEREQPHTAAPLYIPITPTNPGIKPLTQGGAFLTPFLLQMYCATQGASIGYTLNPGPNERWSLYTGPIRLPSGKNTVKAKAVRIGYKESEERTAVIDIYDTVQARIGSSRYTC